MAYTNTQSRLLIPHPYTYMPSPESTGGPSSSWPTRHHHTSWFRCLIVEGREGEGGGGGGGMRRIRKRESEGEE